MRRSYYPAIEGRVSLSEQAERIARGAIKPGSAPNDSTGGDVVYATAPRGYMEVKARPLEGGKATVLLRSGRATTFQDLHAFDSRIDASRPGLLLFSSRHHDRDAVIVFDRARGEIVGRYQFPDLVSVVSPVWGPDGRWAVFSGLVLNGQSDLNVVRFPEGDLERLTDDPYQDLDPSLSPDGRQVDRFRADQEWGTTVPGYVDARVTERLWLRLKEKGRDDEIRRQLLGLYRIR